jgi:hypothetical protein
MHGFRRFARMRGAQRGRSPPLCRHGERLGNGLCTERRVGLGRPLNEAFR